MNRLLTAREVARVAGIAPSTFRAYVARGQAPEPDGMVGSSKVWEESTIRRWRGLGEPLGDDPLQVNAYSSRLWSRGRWWADSTQADLMQLGLSWMDARSILEDRSVGGMPLEKYRDARYLVHLHEDARERMNPALDPVDDGRSEESLIRQAAEKVAAGHDFFAARADLAVELVARGYSEIVMPQRLDPALWDAIESGDADHIADYLRSAQRTNHPAPAGSR